MFKIYLIKNKFITKEAGIVLAKNNHWAVRENLAYFSNDKDVQQILAKDNDVCVRRWLAKNPALNADVKSILEKDVDFYVKYSYKTV